jgi:signal peptidase I
MASGDSYEVKDLSSQLPPALLDSTLHLWQEASQQHWLSTAGSSMNPTIHDKNRVLVSHNVEHLRRGNIVVFRRADKLVAHRVIRISRASNGHIVTTKGDNVVRFDEPIEMHRIIGKVTAIERDGHYIRVDTLQWRIIGWLIATVTIVAAAAYNGLRFTKRRVVGHRRVPRARWLKGVASAVLVRIIAVALLRLPK